MVGRPGRRLRQALSGYKMHNSRSLPVGSQADRYVPDQEPAPVDPRAQDLRLGNRSSTADSYRNKTVNVPGTGAGEDLLLRLTAHQNQP